MHAIWAQAGRHREERRETLPRETGIGLAARVVAEIDPGFGSINPDPSKPHWPCLPRKTIEPSIRGDHHTLPADDLHFQRIGTGKRNYMEALKKKRVRALSAPAPTSLNKSD
ncbi:hypothetical protein WOC76_18945 [Methylocystis sp. IM3]|jgi:hypothetical protein|uniref:hypothetical protein n=1 Tax=unclassified Methylocystis TaxID=2625913 RepID=UPI0030F94589